MIASHSRAFWQKISAAGVLAVLASCSGGSALPEDAVEEHDPGSISGELAVYIADLEDGTSETRYMLRNEAGDEQRLLFDTEPDVEPGAKLHVWGSQTGDALHVSTFKRAFRGNLSGIGSVTQELAMPTPRAPRNVCSVLVAINGGAAPAAITLDSIEAQFHTGPTSVNAYYQENSYGKDSIGGKTYGPLPYTAANNCDNAGLTKALRPMITDPCAQYSWIMVPKQGCAWSGLASVGTPTKPATDTWYNASIGCVVTVQEPGHNYGMNHSSSMTCPAGAWFADDLTGCTHSEYGDRFDPMGGGCRHMNVWQKQYEAWFGGCNAIKVSSSGTFNLLPTELACDGVQSIQLPFPAGKTRTFNRPAGGGGQAGVDTLTSYYLEYRTSVGFDRGMTPQVLVHTGTNPVAMTGQTRGAPHTWILNASLKGLTTQPGLLAGNTFSDPAGGLTVTVQSLDAAKAVIQVDYASAAAVAPTCLDTTALSGPGPDTCNGTVVTTDAGPIPTTGAGGTTGTTRDAGRDTGAAGGGGARPEGGAATGGQAGSGGTQGEGGAGVSGTDADTPGTGGGAGNVSGGPTGAGPTGSAGASVGTGRNNAQGASDLAGGCSCRVGADAPASNKSGLAGLAILGLGGLFGSRRRRRR
jgi:MYXO-CTERM domain-containing protein